MTTREYTRTDRRRDDAIIRRMNERLDLARAARLTDAQLDCNIRTFRSCMPYRARWIDICIAERATRPAGPWPLSPVEQRIRARAQAQNGYAG